MTNGTETNNSQTEAAEPSMEDILASIRKLIADDEDESVDQQLEMPPIPVDKAELGQEPNKTADEIFDELLSASVTLPEEASDSVSESSALNLSLIHI